MLQVYINENQGLSDLLTGEHVAPGVNGTIDDLFETAGVIGHRVTYHPEQGSLLPLSCRLAQTAESRIEAYSIPYPMAVFGTLRKDCGNHHRMKVAPIAKLQKAFLPHFAAKGLGIYGVENSCAPFEVYHYTPDNWNKMIPGVDRLESFSPNRSPEDSWGYHRTLMAMRLLPDDFDHPLFANLRDAGSGEWRPSVNLSEYRDLAIPPGEWEKYPVVYAWVYSNKDNNQKVAKLPGQPVRWE